LSKLECTLQAPLMMKATYPQSNYTRGLNYPEKNVFLRETEARRASDKVAKTEADLERYISGNVGPIIIAL
jgi:hypothetical protein